MTPIIVRFAIAIGASMEASLVLKATLILGWIASTWWLTPRSETRPFMSWSSLTRTEPLVRTFTRPRPIARRFARLRLVRDDQQAQTTFRAAIMWN